MTPTLVLLALMASTPVPLHRPLPQAPVVGTWMMRWGGVTDQAVLSPDGSYRWGVWSGRWSWDGKSRTLFVSEGIGDSPSLHWAAQLDRSLSGALVPTETPPTLVSLRKLR